MIYLKACCIKIRILPHFSLHFLSQTFMVQEKFPSVKMFSFNFPLSASKQLCVTVDGTFDAFALLFQTVRLFDPQAAFEDVVVQ